MKTGVTHSVSEWVHSFVTVEEGGEERQWGHVVGPFKGAVCICFIDGSSVTNPAGSTPTQPIAPNTSHAGNEGTYYAHFFTSRAYAPKQ